MCPLKKAVFKGAHARVLSVGKAHVLEHTVCTRTYVFTQRPTPNKRTGIRIGSVLVSNMADSPDRRAAARILHPRVFRHITQDSRVSSHR